LKLSRGKEEKSRIKVKLPRANVEDAGSQNKGEGSTVETQKKREDQGGNCAQGSGGQQSGKP